MCTVKVSKKSYRVKFIYSLEKKKKHLLTLEMIFITSRWLHVYKICNLKWNGIKSVHCLLRGPHKKIRIHKELHS